MQWQLTHDESYCLHPVVASTPTLTGFPPDNPPKSVYPRRLSDCNVKDSVG